MTSHQIFQKNSGTVNKEDKLKSGWLIGFLEKMMKLILKLKIQNLLIGNGKAIRIYLV